MTNSSSQKMKKPTVEQVGWVFKHIAEHIMEGGTFRYLIYDRMGFKPNSYRPLYLAGGMFISDLQVVEGEEEEKKGEDDDK